MGYYMVQCNKHEKSKLKRTEECLTACSLDGQKGWCYNTDYKHTFGSPENRILRIGTQKKPLPVLPDWSGNAQDQPTIKKEGIAMQFYHKSYQSSMVFSAAHHPWERDRMAEESASRIFRAPIHIVLRRSPSMLGACQGAPERRHGGCTRRVEPAAWLM